MNWNEADEEMMARSLPFLADDGGSGAYSPTQPSPGQGQGPPSQAQLVTPVAEAVAISPRALSSPRPTGSRAGRPAEASSHSSHSLLPLSPFTSRQSTKAGRELSIQQLISQASHHGSLYKRSSPGGDAAAANYCSFFVSVGEAELPPVGGAVAVVSPPPGVLWSHGSGKSFMARLPVSLASATDTVDGVQRRLAELQATVCRAHSTVEERMAAVAETNRRTQQFLDIVGQQQHKSRPAQQPSSQPVALALTSAAGRPTSQALRVPTSLVASSAGVLSCPSLAVASSSPNAQTAALDDIATVETPPTTPGSVALSSTGTGRDRSWSGSGGGGGKAPPYYTLAYRGTEQQQQQQASALSPFHAPGHGPGGFVRTRRSSHIVTRDGNELINNYCIREMIGRGAIGCVFLAVDRRTREPFAIKSITSRRRTGLGVGVGGNARWRRRLSGNVSAIVMGGGPTALGVYAAASAPSGGGGGGSTRTACSSSASTLLVALSQRGRIGQSAPRSSRDGSSIEDLSQSEGTSLVAADGSGGNQGRPSPPRSASFRATCHLHRVTHPGTVVVASSPPQTRHGVELAHLPTFAQEQHQGGGDGGDGDLCGTVGAAAANLPSTTASLPSAAAAALETVLSPIEHEIRLLRRLDHRSVVRLHEVVDDEEEGIVHLVLDFLPGGAITAAHPFDPALGYAGCEVVRPLSRLAQMARELCDALRHLQRRHVVHNDLKPENILLDEDGCVVLADFGESILLPPGSAAKDGHLVSVTTAGPGRWASLAQSQLAAVLDSISEVPAYGGGAALSSRSMYALSNAQGAAEWFQPDSSMYLNAGVGADGRLNNRIGAGTPAFSPPELIDRNECSAATDMWSLGVVLYGALFGRLPFAGRTLRDTFDAVLVATLAIPSLAEVPEADDLSPELHAQWADVCARLLVRSPTERMTVRALAAHPLLRGTAPAPSRPAATAVPARPRSPRRTLAAPQSTLPDMTAGASGNGLVGLPRDRASLNSATSLQSHRDSGGSSGAHSHQDASSVLTLGTLSVSSQLVSSSSGTASSSFPPLQTQLLASCLPAHPPEQQHQEECLQAPCFPLRRLLLSASAGLERSAVAPTVRPATDQRGASGDAIAVAMGSAREPGALYPLSLGRQSTGPRRRSSHHGSGGPLVLSSDDGSDDEPDRPAAADVGADETAAAPPSSPPFSPPLSLPTPPCPANATVASPPLDSEGTGAPLSRELNLSSPPTPPFEAATRPQSGWRETGGSSLLQCRLLTPHHPHSLPQQQQRPVASGTVKDSPAPPRARHRCGSNTLCPAPSVEPGTAALRRIDRSGRAPNRHGATPSLSPSSLGDSRAYRPDSSTACSDLSDRTMLPSLQTSASSSSPPHSVLEQLLECSAQPPQPAGLEKPLGDSCHGMPPAFSSEEVRRRQADDPTPTAAA